MKPSIDTKQLSTVIFVAFVIGACWGEFGPKDEPGSEEFTQGTMLLASAVTKQDISRAADMYRRAIIAGNKPAALALAKLMALDDTADKSQVRIWQYALMSMALDEKLDGKTGLELRDALGANAEEIKAAEALKVVEILSGNVVSISDGTVLQK